MHMFIKFKNKTETIMQYIKDFVDQEVLILGQKDKDFAILQDKATIY